MEKPNLTLQLADVMGKYLLEVYAYNQACANEVDKLKPQDTISEIILFAGAQFACGFLEITRNFNPKPEDVEKFVKVIGKSVEAELTEKIQDICKHGAELSKTKKERH